MTVKMSQVSVFDVESAFNSTSAKSNNGWYTQTIVGLAPDPRVDFCVVMISAPDESSFNIHMYGGKYAPSLALMVQTAYRTLRNDRMESNDK